MKFFCKLMMIICMLLWNNTMLNGMDVTQVTYDQLVGKLRSISEKASATVLIGTDLNLKLFLVAAFGSTHESFDFSHLTVYYENENKESQTLKLNTEDNITMLMQFIYQQTIDDIDGFKEIDIPTQKTFKQFFQEESSATFETLKNFLQKSSSEINSNIKKVFGKSWNEITTAFLTDENNYKNCFEPHKIHTTTKTPKGFTMTYTGQQRPKTHEEFLFSYYHAVDEYLRKMITKEDSTLILQAALNTLKSKLIALKTSLSLLKQKS